MKPAMAPRMASVRVAARKMGKPTARTPGQQCGNQDERPVDALRQRHARRRAAQPEGDQGSAGQECPDGAGLESAAQPGRYQSTALHAAILTFALAVSLGPGWADAC